MNSTSIKCGDCGQPLTDTTDGERQPCPNCGGTSRAYCKSTSGQVQVSSSLQWTHTKTFYEKNRTFQILVIMLSIGGFIIGSLFGLIGVALSAVFGVAAYFIGPKAVIMVREIRRGETENK